MYVVPEGFSLVRGPPKALNQSLVGKFVFLKWHVTGWEVGKVQSYFSRGHGSQKFNYDIKWMSDGSLRGYKLSLESYGGGDNKAVGSWVLLSDK